MPTTAGISLSLADIAAQLGGFVLGDDQILISQVATLTSAGSGDITFLANMKYKSLLLETKASAVILSSAFSESLPVPCIVTENPYAYYARLATLLNPVAKAEVGVHTTAICLSELPSTVSIGANVSIGVEVKFGENIVVHPGCVIGDRVRIGSGSILYPNVTVYAGCEIGDNAIIHSGVVIGADGFGFAPDKGQWVKIPQIGRVVIGHDVEIGACTSIDRGALDDTVIGDGTKLDNQIQIGHNCVIGKNCVIAGCAAIAGSVTLQDNVIVGGSAMITGHLTIASGVVVSGGSLVMKSLTKPGKYTAIFPLAEHAEWIQNAAQVRRLSKLVDRVSALEKKLKEHNIRD